VILAGVSRPVQHRGGRLGPWDGLGEGQV